MKYEISNTIFKKKPDDETMRRRYPFKRIKQQVWLMEDKPEVLFKAYSDGLTFKPHPFTKNNLSNAKVNAIVLDFDHLTKEQCQFLANICYARRFHSNPIYGDYSAGTKFRINENKDIPGYVNPKWGYKVFYPVNCLCVWSELNKAFLDAVIYFNPHHDKNEAAEVWSKWLKANNNKEKVKNPIFANWILPDVAMLNSYRTQVTYGVRPNQKEDFEKLENMPKYANGLFKYPCGGLEDYDGLEWKPEEISAYYEPNEETLKQYLPVFVQSLSQTLAAMRNTDFQNLTIGTPTSRSGVARRLKKRQFDDLVWDTKENAIINAWFYSNAIENSDRALKVGKRIAKCLTRNLIEIERQRSIHFDKWDAIKGHSGALTNDILVGIMQKCGLNVLKERMKKMNKRTKRLEETQEFKFGQEWQLEEIATAIIEACLNYDAWTMRMKMRHMKEIGILKGQETHMEALRKYCQSKCPELLEDYNAKRATWFNENKRLVFKVVQMPYTYTKRGLKKWLIETACLDLPEEELSFFGFEPVKLKDKDEWVEWCHKALSSRNDDMNDVDDETMKSWFKDYRRRFNEKFKSEKIRKGRTSKYDELFKDMTKEQIADYIKKSDLHPNMKTRLRGLYIGKRKYDKN